jgi:hypothetical protein
MALKQVIFETSSSTSDWRFPYQLIMPTVGGWDPDVDEVVIGMSPDSMIWDDYGSRARNYPSTSAMAWFQASSNDGSGIVTLVDPNLIDILVPARTIRSFGIGSVAVGIQYRNMANGARSTLLSGRLPLADGVI